MTPTTKIITGIAIVAVASFAGYKIYKHYKIKKYFPKNTNNNDDDKSAMLKTPLTKITKPHYG